MTIAAAAICAAFTSCSHDFDFDQAAQEDRVQSKYDQAFLNYIGGTIDPDQDWGFSATRGITRSGNTGDTYPATHEYKDANGNVIAAANMNHNEWGDPNKKYGGWIVPDPLTSGQKERVKAYFQANPDLDYEDPHLRHFFVQQVYKGGPSTAGTNSTEQVVAADGSKYTSDNMNHLTVGTANSHINDFNSGTCSTSNVLNHEGKTQNDEITLMVNVDDTSCFGYHDSGSSNQSSASPNHNDKMALVSAATIDAWAATHGNPGEAVTDKWNRSFMGFDLAIKEGAQAYDTKADGTINYATYDQAPETPEYAWDGQNIIKISTGEWETVEVGNQWSTWTVRRPVYKNEYKYIMKGTETIGWLTTNENFYIAADKVTLDQSYQVNGGPSNLNGIKNAVILKEFTVNGTKYQSVINLPKIQQLVNDGYLPVNNKSLQDWVQVGVSDGYFSDWIVTLTEAKRQTTEKYDLKIIAEDLSAQGNTDFDFNDIVLEVKYGSPAKIKLTHAGGTLPLVICGSETTVETVTEDYEVHDLFGVGRNEMVNTGRGPVCSPVLLHELTTNPLRVNIANAKEANEKLKLFVYKEKAWHEMKAPKGEPACKLAVGIDYPVLGERVSIIEEYPNFVGWANGTSFVSEWWKTENQ